MKKDQSVADLFPWLERRFVNQTFDEKDIECVIQEIRRLLDKNITTHQLICHTISGNDKDRNPYW
jgi:hypothetical protein